MSDFEPIPVILPREGLPTLISTEKKLNSCADQLASGHGPIAIDAERASGFKYSQRAYLVQLRRAGSGTFLVDPTNFDNLHIIQESIGEIDWILHAASQDLVCLDQVGLKPIANLFDTELAGRLLGFPKVGLGTLTQELLNVGLAKEHSAADWSTRPLPEEWLAYAALDVEFLIELWEVLATQLQEQNKYEWALQEFEHVRVNTSQIIRQDPWRKISGIHKLKTPRQLAVARSLWEARDEIARSNDIASGRVLSDLNLIEIANSKDWANALLLQFMKIRGISKYLDIWALAFNSGINTDDSLLPPLKIKNGNPPHPRNWQTRNPEAFAKLERIRGDLIELASTLNLPVENLITPEVIRKAIWQEPNGISDLENIFDENKVRNWQRNQVRQILVRELNLN